jgi:hypothetical protein
MLTDSRVLKLVGLPQSEVPGAGRLRGVIPMIGSLFEAPPESLAAFGGANKRPCRLLRGIGVPASPS